MHLQCCELFVMALTLMLKPWCFSVALLSIATLLCNLGAAQDYGEDAPQIIAKALVCFDNQIVYSHCDEAYRLTESGDIDVPYDATDAYCNGPCFGETTLVLDCLDGILSNFLFYNKATIKVMRDTLNDGCSTTSKRGDFNVAEHLLNESSHGERLGYTNHMWFGYGLLLVSQLIGILLQFI